MDSQSSSSERQVETEPAAKRPKKEESLQEKVKRGRDDDLNHNETMDGTISKEDEKTKELEKELEYMKQLLARKDEENAKKDEQLAEKDEEITKKDEQLAAKDEEITKKDEQLAEKDEETKQLRAEKAKKDEQLERQSKRRLIENPPSMSLKRIGYKGNITASSNHIRAKAIKHEVVALETKFSEGLSSSSHLLLNFGEHTTKNGADDNLVRDYTSEADVSSYVSAALKDAVELVESATGRSFHVSHDFSLFANRPDHLVLVEKESMVPVLAVEDKKPWGANRGEEIKGKVLGQVYDYLLEFKMLGHRAPFVDLSSFTESCLFWLDSRSSNAWVKQENRLSVLMNSSDYSASPTKSAATKDLTQSPPELKTENEVNCIGKGEFREIGRIMCRSKETYPPEKLVPLLYTAILCGLSGIPPGRCKTLYKRPRGYDGLALRLDRRDYGWGLLKLAEGKSVYKWKGNESRTRKLPYSDNTYFDVGTIARGSTSKAVDAYDSSGNRCVIKMYLKQAKNKYGHPLSNAESKAVGKKACKLEVERLQMFYDFLKDKVHYKELRGFPCIIMPFFEPLTKAERNKSMGDMTEIRDCLKSFRDGNGRHWKYSDGDLRWHHVGYFCDGNQRRLVMFDLADLETVEEKEFDSTVASQVEDLKKRLPPSAAEQQSTTK